MIKKPKLFKFSVHYYVSSTKRVLGSRNNFKPEKIDMIQITTLKIILLNSCTFTATAI